MYKMRYETAKKDLELMEAELDMVTTLRETAELKLKGFGFGEESPVDPECIEKLKERSEEVGRVRAEVEKQREKVEYLKKLYEMEGE